MDKDKQHSGRSGLAKGLAAYAVAATITFRVAALGLGPNVVGNYFSTNLNPRGPYAFNLSLGTNVGAVVPNEFWISANPQANGGRGTLAEPFDGSTMDNFDALMQNLPSDARIHLLAGTFITSGDHATNNDFTPWFRNGRISGAGMDATTVMMTSNTPVPAGGGPAVIIPIIGSGTIEVSDMTVDGNPANTNSPITIKGVNIYGQSCAIRRVRFQNLVEAYNGVDYNGEGFLCSVGGNPAITNGVIEGCEFYVLQGNHFGQDCISAIPPINARNIDIYGNTILYSGPWQLSDCLAFGAFGEGLRIHDNYIYGLETGIYSDTFGYTNLFMYRNVFDQTQYPIFCAAASHKNLYVQDNLFLMPSNGIVFRLDSEFSQNTTNFVFQRNAVLTPTGTNASSALLWGFGSNPGQGAHDNLGVNGCYVMDNWIASDLSVWPQNQPNFSLTNYSSAAYPTNSGTFNVVFSNNRNVEDGLPWVFEWTNLVTRTVNSLFANSTVSVKTNVGSGIVPPSGAGSLWVSNGYDLYWVTPTVTNLIKLGH